MLGIKRIFILTIFFYIFLHLHTQHFLLYTRKINVNHEMKDVKKWHFNIVGHILVWSRCLCGCWDRCYTIFLSTETYQVGQSIISLVLHHFPQYWNISGRSINYVSGVTPFASVLKHIRWVNQLPVYIYWSPFRSVVTFLRNITSKLADLASDWLKHFLLLFNKYSMPNHLSGHR